MKYAVEIYDPECEDWDRVGAVLLPPGSARWAVEGALAVVGIYAPRGADELEWHHGAVAATIVDGNGCPMVRLLDER